MDISNNYMFYKGYEGEQEIIFQFVDDNNMSIHIWGGYIDDIMNNQPGTDDDYKKGLSYDWNTLEGPYSDNNKEIINIDDYYNDLLRLKDVQFKYEESKEVYNLLLLFLNKAMENNKKIEVIVD